MSIWIIRLRFMPVGLWITTLSISSSTISTVNYKTCVYLEIFVINLEIFKLSSYCLVSFSV